MADAMKGVTVQNVTMAEWGAKERVISVIYGDKINLWRHWQCKVFGRGAPGSAFDTCRGNECEKGNGRSGICRVTSWWLTTKAVAARTHCGDEWADGPYRLLAQDQGSCLIRDVCLASLV